MDAARMQRGQRSRSSFAAVAAILCAPLVLLLLVVPWLSGPGADTTTTTLAGLAGMWVVAAAAVAVVSRWERRPLSSIGLAWPGWRRLLLALGIGAALSLAVPLLSLLASSVLPAPADGSIAAAARIPWWLMALAVLTAGVTEELVYRGYALERLFEWSGSRWLGSAIALAAFTGVHVGGWNAAHVVGVVLPLGVALTLLYWWQRNVVFVMVVHVMVNLPLVFMAVGDA